MHWSSALINEKSLPKTMSTDMAPWASWARVDTTTWVIMQDPDRCLATLKYLSSISSPIDVWGSHSQNSISHLRDSRYCSIILDILIQSFVYRLIVFQILSTQKKTINFKNLVIRANGIQIYIRKIYYLLIKFIYRSGFSIA